MGEEPTLLMDDLGSIEDGSDGRPSVTLGEELVSFGNSHNTDKIDVGGSDNEGASASTLEEGFYENGRSSPTKQVQSFDGVQTIPLSRLESRLNSLLISELEVVSASQGVLETTIQELRELRDHLSAHLGSPDKSHATPDSRKKASQLLHTVNREMHLYEQFLGKNAEKLDLANILRETPEDNEDYVNVDYSSTISSETPNLNAADDSMDTQSQSSHPSEYSLIRGDNPPTTRSHHARSVSASSIHSPRSNFSNGLQMEGSQMSSDFSFSDDGIKPIPPAPFDLFRWTRLKRISEQLVSQGQQFGTPSASLVKGGIFVGTTKSLVLIFDFSQNLQSVIGTLES
ncbi:Vacuolar protein sorting-associated protein 8, partial [Quaeritorhiza haematococci]